MKGSEILSRGRSRIARSWARLGDAAFALAVFAAALAAYIRTLAPSVVTLFDDSLEFPLVAQRLAIVHPTGYPLYTLLARLAALVARPRVAWGVNLLSALSGALTVALVYLACRELTRRRLPALLAVLALACAPVFWSQAVVAEVYTLNSAFVAALLWLALRWARRPVLPAVRGLPAAPGRARRLPTLPWPAIHWRRAFPAGQSVTASARTAGRRGDLFLAADPNRLGDLRRRAAAARTWMGRAVSRVRNATAAAWSGARRLAGPAARRPAAVYRRLYPPVPPDCRLRPAPLAYVLAAVFGLALTHHRTIVLLLPPLLAYALATDRRAFSRAALLGPEHPTWPAWRRFGARPGVLLAACLAGPLLLYLYLPLRGHMGSLDGTYTNTFAGFWRWVLGTGYTVFLGDNPLARELGPGFYAGLFWQQFGPLGLALALLGLFALLRPGWPRRQAVPRLLALDWDRPRALLLTGLTFAAYLAFAVLYRVPDVEVFLIPAFIPVALWLAAGLAWAARWMRPRGPSAAGRRLAATARVGLFVAAAVLPPAIAARQLPDLDLSRRWAALDFGRTLAEALPPGSTVIGLGGEINLLRYVSETEGPSAEVETLIADGEAERLDAVKRALAEGKRVYLTRPLAGLAGNCSLGAVIGALDVGGETEALIRVAPTYYEPPARPNVMDLEMAPGVRLVGHDVQERRAHWQAWAQVRLWWRASTDHRDRLKVSARLVAPDALSPAGEGQLVAAVDAEPVANAYPTPDWLPGEVVADAYEIPLPVGLPPGDYVPLIVVYDPATGAERGRTELPAVHLSGNPERPPRRELRAGVARLSPALFAKVELLGWTPPDPSATFQPGDRLPLTLLWRARRAASGAWRVQLFLAGSSDTLLAEAPLGGGFATARWTAGQLVRQWPSLRVPSGTPPGAYHLRLRVLRDGRPVPWGHWLLPLGSDLHLGTIEVAP